jgi:ribosomal-protein-alanine N-acetyltransferase
MKLDGEFAHLSSLTTNRLRMRPMQKDDVEAVFAFKSDLEVTKCYGQDPHRSIDETAAWIQRNLTDHERHVAMMWAITFKDKDDAIGECCLWNFDPNYQCAEIGYELNPSHWHMGIMTEVLSAILTYGFVDLGLNRIEATPLAINEPSRNILLGLGFKHEGTLRQRCFFHHQHFDQLYFGLLKEEWMERQLSI